MGASTRAVAPFHHRILARISVGIAKEAEDDDHSLIRHRNTSRKVAKPFGTTSSAYAFHAIRTLREET
jgi:hypothetical protein